MSQQYEALTSTESVFVVILLVLYVAALLIGLIFWGATPCVLAPERDCGFAEYFKRLLPFYGFTFAINIAIVLAAYYNNKLSKKSILIFRALFLPPVLCVVYYLYRYGDDLLKAFTL